MATRIAENVACLQIFGTLAGQDVMNDFYYRYAAQPTHEDLVDLVQAADAAVIETWAENLPGSWIGRSTFAFDMTAVAGATGVSDGIAGLVGSVTGVPLPNNVTIAIARKNGLRGRSGNGRIFWMGLSQAQLASTNIVAAGSLAAIVVCCKAMDAAAADLDAEPVILSFQKAGVVSTTATVYTLTDWLATDDTLDSRRRRLPKRGS